MEPSVAYQELLALVQSAAFRERFTGANAPRRLTLTVEINDGKLTTARFAEEMRVGYELSRDSLRRGANLTASA